MKLRQVKSEIPGRFIKRKIKMERSRTPLRYSRRLRNLPPEHVEFYENVRNKLKRDKVEKSKHVISRDSSVQWHNQKGCGQRKLHYPQKAKNSKEIISIFSAPKVCNKKMSYSRKKIIEIPMRVRGSSCRPKLMVKTRNDLRSHYTVSKTTTNIKKEHPQGPERILENRKKYVLEVLNKGDIKDIEKLPSVGSKTAERIILYRQLKGCITRISELAKMPKFPRRRFHNFVAQNFLRVD